MGQRMARPQSTLTPRRGRQSLLATGLGSWAEWDQRVARSHIHLELWRMWAGSLFGGQVLA